MEDTCAFVDITPSQSPLDLVKYFFTGKALALKQTDKRVLFTFGLVPVTVNEIRETNSALYFGYEISGCLTGGY